MTNSAALAARKRLALWPTTTRSSTSCLCAANHELARHELTHRNTGQLIAGELTSRPPLRSAPRATSRSIPIVSASTSSSSSDPLEPQPHDPDVRALLRIAVVWNVPIACNRSTADFLITSRLFGEPYLRRIAPALGGSPTKR